MSRSIGLLFSISALAFAGLALAGCATMFHSGPRELEITAPMTVTLKTDDGKPLPGKMMGQKQIVVPPRGADSILLVYHGRTQAAYLTKKPSWWLALDYLNDGIGLGIDDLTQSWFNYEPLVVYIDSSRLKIYSNAELQDDTPKQRPKLLLMGGIGPGIHGGTFGNTQPIGFPTSYAGDFNAEAGAGLDFYKQVQVFYRTRADFAEFDVPGPTGEISYSFENMNGIAARFFHNNVFLQTSYNWGTLSGNGYDSTGQFRSFSDRQVSLIGIGLGVSGDLSYLTLEYTLEARPFALATPGPFTMRWITLMYGLNFRL